jgi:hypothetical protein
MAPRSQGARPEHLFIASWEGEAAERSWVPCRAGGQGALGVGTTSMIEKAEEGLCAGTEVPSG